MLFIVLGVLVLQGFTLFLWQRDRSRMLNAVLARTPHEFIKLEGKKKPVVEKDPDLVDATEIPFGW